MPISWLEILHICIIFGTLLYELQYILSFENFIFVDFLAVKINGSEVKPGICVAVNTHSYTEILKIYHLILNRIGTI